AGTSLAHEIDARAGSGYGRLLWAGPIASGKRLPSVGRTLQHGDPDSLNCGWCSGCLYRRKPADHTAVAATAPGALGVAGVPRRAALFPRIRIAQSASQAPLAMEFPSSR